MLILVTFGKHSRVYNAVCRGFEGRKFVCNLRLCIPAAGRRRALEFACIYMTARQRLFVLQIWLVWTAALILQSQTLYFETWSHSCPCLSVLKRKETFYWGVAMGERHKPGPYTSYWTKSYTGSPLRYTTVRGMLKWFWWCSKRQSLCWAKTRLLDLSSAAPSKFNAIVSEMLLKKLKGANIKYKAKITPWT